MGDQVPPHYLIRYETKIGDGRHLYHSPRAKRFSIGTEQPARTKSNNPLSCATSQQSRANEHVPHALQMLFPTSSLRQRGVVLVPQLAQLSAPTVLRTLDRLPLGVCAVMTGEESGPDVSPDGSFATTAAADGATSTFCGVCPLAVSAIPP